MIHLFLVFTLFFSVSLFAENINKKIFTTSSKINQVSKNYTYINNKMAKNASNILQQKRVIRQQKVLLKTLKRKLLLKESSYKENKVELESLVKLNEKLKKNQNFLEEELIFVIAQNVSLSLMLEGDFSTNEESIMEYEILKIMLKSSTLEAKELNTAYYDNTQNIESLTKEVTSLNKSIGDIDSKRKKLIYTQKMNKKSLVKLNNAKNSYKKQLNKLLKRQGSLKTTLNKLNIVRIDQLKIEKEKLAREKELASERSKNKYKESFVKVKQLGNSYQAIKTKRYKGVTTIAPIDNYTITKKYGTYIDPIYGMKIFNESISLKPNSPNAKVKTVFNGKVIYADKTAVLNNIVIVEHRNGLHTIYANLSKIAPSIKKGKKIRKGSSIGRVEDELIFEVTQRSAHINPIRLFK